MKKIWEYVQKHQLIENGDKVIVGLSGGADSVCLLFVLLSLQNELDFSVYAVHINHMIRGQEAKRDAKFVENLCKKHGIPLKIVEREVSLIAKQEKMGIEEAGRKVRYEVFEAYADEIGGGKIALAHHQNDLAETMIYHLARGTDLAGLSAIRPMRGRYIRPLLCLSRKEIEQYLTENEIEYVTDSTNLEDHYMRNRIRHQVVEYLEKQVNEKTVSHMSETAESLGELQDYLVLTAEQKLKQYGILKENTIYLEDTLFKEQDVIVRYTIRAALDRLSGGFKDITREHFAMIQGLAKKEVGKQICLPYHLIVKKEYKGISIKKYLPEKEFSEQNFSEQNLSKRNENLKIEEQQVFIPGETYFCGWQLKSDFLTDILEEIPKKTYTKWLNYDRIQSNLVLRFRKPGDFIVINSQGGKKKLKDYLIDLKIPQEERDHIPLLCSGQEVLWVIGYRISEAYKVTNSTKKILKLQIRGGIGHE